MLPPPLKLLGGGGLAPPLPTPIVVLSAISTLLVSYLHNPRVLSPLHSLIHVREVVDSHIYLAIRQGFALSRLTL